MKTAELTEALLQSIRVDYLLGAPLNGPLAPTLVWRRLPYALVLTCTSGTILCEYERHPTVELNASNSIVIPADVAHRFRQHRPEPMTGAWIHVRFTVLDSIDILSLLDLPTFIDEDGSREIHSIIDAQITRHRTMSIDLSQVVHAHDLGARLLTAVVAASVPKAQWYKSIQQTQRLLPVLNYVRDHMDKPISRDFLAERMYLSPTRFHVVFSEVMGMAPMAYVKQERLRRARHLLIATDMPISAVATAVGYRDPYHFSRQFKANSGASPHHYRQRLKAFG